MNRSHYRHNSHRHRLRRGDSCRTALDDRSLSHLLRGSIIVCKKECAGQQKVSANGRDENFDERQFSTADDESKDDWTPSLTPNVK